VDDVTPEATRDVIDREAPGIAEAMRLASREHVPKHWMLSRAVSGSRGRTLIVNFPGNPNAIEQAGKAITPSLGHALGLLRRQ
jgi:molybdopterin biosynthesis enzyme MoaB